MRRHQRRGASPRPAASRSLHARSAGTTSQTGMRTHPACLRGMRGKGAPCNSGLPPRLCAACHLRRARERAQGQPTAGSACSAPNPTQPGGWGTRSVPAGTRHAPATPQAPPPHRRRRPCGAAAALAAAPPCAWPFLAACCWELGGFGCGGRGVARAHADSSGRRRRREVVLRFAITALSEVCCQRREAGTAQCGEQCCDCWAPRGCRCRASASRFWITRTIAQTIPRCRGGLSRP